LQVNHGTRASATLDAARGLAALAVLANHTRSLWFAPPAALPPAARGPVTDAFYLATGLGHEAVLVFFVLSGFFVGAAIRRRHAPGATWLWRDYLVDRLSRLSIVLLPALLLTLLWDTVGAAHLPALYDGAWPDPLMGFDVAARHGADTFVLNALYLQTFAAPTFGSNGPLWSLAYELWFYLLFPLALRAFVSPRPRERFITGALFAATLALAHESFLTAFPMWLLGASLTLLPAPRLPRPLTRALPLLGAAALAATFVVARHDDGLLGDYALAVGVAAWLYGVAAAPDADAPTDHILARGATGLAAFSYTLYAVHLPFAAALRAIMAPADAAGPAFAPTPTTVALFATLLVLALLYAWAVAFLTEARTHALRALLRRGLRLPT